MCGVLISGHGKYGEDLCHLENGTEYQASPWREITSFQSRDWFA